MQQPSIDRTSAPSATPKRRRRRWPRFGLRTLLIVLTLAAVFLGFVGRRWHQAQRQATAVAYIKNLGGYVAYDYSTYDDDTITLGSPTPWVERLPFLGIDFFHDVIGVDVDDNVHYPDDAEGRRLSLETSAILATFPRLKSLSIGGVNLEPGRLTQLGRAGTLRSLRFRDSFDERVAAEVRNLANLEYLRIDMEPASNASLHLLSALSQLKTLELSALQPQHDLSQLGILPRLSQLNVYHAQGIELDRLAAQPALTEFYMSRASGVEQLCGALVKHSNLQDVTLLETDLSDSDLDPLADCKKLESVTVGTTNVTGRAFAMSNRWSNLSIVNIFAGNVTDDTLPYIARLPAIKTLHAPQNELTVDAVAEAPWSTTIEEIDCDCDAKPEQRHFAAFAKLPNLRSLTINRAEYIDQVEAIRSKRE